ncbi:GNAT family N-acetyltransferase [Alkalihalobacillus sp. R86527]|uniref:GNAT family N-acetyltransferase n=1 Tax=Alkalihalobacillus sp. R86527 TaxID=3093863 RepID=UPI00366AE935
MNTKLDNKIAFESSCEDYVLRTEANALSSPRWHEFNEAKWGVKTHKIAVSESAKKYPCIEGTFFLNKKNQIVQPPLNAYTPILFKSTPTNSPRRLYHQRSRLSEKLIHHMLDIGVSNNVLFLPTDYTDVRPWKWANFDVGVRYTFLMNFPYSIEKAGPSVRSRYRKLCQNGFRVERTNDMSLIYNCLIETEIRNGFSHSLSLKDLELAQDIMGEDMMRSYVTYSPDGKPVSGSVVLHKENGRGISWLVGYKRDYAQDSPNTLMDVFCFSDLHKAGATGIDLVGANMKSVADNKAAWGGEMVPYYTIELNSWKTVARSIRDYVRCKNTLRSKV